MTPWLVKKYATQAQKCFFFRIRMEKMISRVIRCDKADPMTRQSDISLAGDLLYWKPSVIFDEGLQNKIAWFRSKDVNSSSGLNFESRNLAKL